MDSNKLKELSLVLQEIVVPLRNLDRVQQLPLFRAEVWMGDQMLDESDDIIAVSNRGEQTLKLTINTANFRYKVEELFGKRKVVRLMIKLFRESIYHEEQELLDQFKIVLSWYSYQFSSELRNWWKQHSVGTIHYSFLHYGIKCVYQQPQENKGPLSDKANMVNVPRLNRHDLKQYKQYKIDESIDHLDQILGFQSYSVKALPLQSLEMNDDVRIEKTFVSTKKLMPIFRNQGQQEDNMAIKLDKSFVDYEIQSVKSSTFEEKEKLEKKITKMEVYFYYIFILLGIYIIGQLMVPSLRI